MISIERIIGMALQDRTILDQLADALASDLVVANPLYRRITEFATHFHSENQKLPQEGDWQLWRSSLTDSEREGLWEALQRLLSQRVDGFEPDFFGTRVLEELQKVAAQNARSRLNALQEIDPASFRVLAERIEAVTAPMWPEEPDVPGPPDPERIPLEVMPPVLRNYAESLAASGQVPEEMPGILLLAVVSAAAAGKYVLRPDGAWDEEWTPLYAVVVAEPGERKSYVFRHATTPVQRWEKEQARELAPKLSEAEDAVAINERALQDAIRDQDQEGAALAREALEQARSGIPVIPRLLVSDGTPEAIVRRMAQQGGRAAIMAPEGGPLQLLAGRYSEGVARLEELAQGYDGEDIIVERIGRDDLRVHQPTLTLAVTLQPSVLDSIRNARSMRGQGIFGRISWVWASSRVGTRVDSSEAPILDAAAQSQYDRTIRQLLDWEPAGVEDDGTPKPHPLTLSPEAQAAKREYHDEVESDMAPGGRLSGIAHWANKTVGRAIRIAALLEVARRADSGAEIEAEPISGDMMEAGVRICRALTTHALHTLAHADQDEPTGALVRVWQRARGLAPGSTEQDLYQALRNTTLVRTMADLEPLVDALVDRGCLRRRPQAATGRKGRPRSPIIEIHPRFRRTLPDNPKKRVSGFLGGPIQESSPGAAEDKARSNPPTDPLPDLERASPGLDHQRVARKRREALARRNVR